MNFPFSLPLLLDGRMTVSAAGKGHCQAQWLCSHPEALEKHLKESLYAGVGALCAPTFEAHPLRLREYGLEEQTERINRTLLELTKRFAPEGMPVGGILAPTGLFLPPDGEAEFEDIYDHYRDQVRALDNAGAEFFLIAQQDSLADMRAAVLAVRSTNLPVFVTIRTDKNGRTLSGGSLLPCLITLQAMDVDAIGIQSSLTPEEMLPLLQEIVPHSSLPVMAIPSPGIPGRGTFLAGGEAFLLV